MVENLRLYDLNHNELKMEKARTRLKDNSGVLIVRSKQQIKPCLKRFFRNDIVCIVIANEREKGEKEKRDDAY